MTDWGRGWSPHKDRDDDVPHARYRPRRPLAEILDEARSIVARAAQPASGRLVMLGLDLSRAAVATDDADALSKLEARVEHEEYPVAVLIVTVTSIEGETLAKADLGVTILSDFAEDEELEKLLITVVADFRRSLEIGPDGLPLMRLDDRQAE